MKRILTGSLLSLFALCAHAGDGSSIKEPSAAQMFVVKATEDGMTEVELGKLAQSRSRDDAVKAFAAKMVADHTKANAELATIAKRAGLEVPDQLDGAHNTILHAVGTKPASEFDAEYGRRMLEAHDAAVTLFTDAAALREKEIADFAKKTLPTLHKHQQLAASLPAKRPAPAGGESGAAAAATSAADVPAAQ